MSAKHWVILIGAGYGAFLFEGSEKEAEELRSHKARWEGGVGKKRHADQVEIDSGKASHCWNHAGFNNNSFYRDCDCDNESCVIDAQERLAKATPPRRKPKGVHA